MKNIVLFSLILFSLNLVNAQNSIVPKTEFTKMYLPVWLEATQHCLEVAETMPEKKYNYKPTELSKSFGEQMVHIAAANKLLTQRYVEGLDVQPSTPDASKMTKAEILKLLNDSFVYTTNVIRNVGQDALDETCKMYHSGNTVSRAFALFYVQDHMANHRAKANLYIRMNNIEPPGYTW
ncbi:MAG: DinB family protein [Aurantibacter sp.]